MNICVFDGRLVRDPELKTLPNGAKVVNFTLAINSPRKAKSGELIKDVSFLEFEAWDSGAELIAEKCRKGNALSVVSAAKSDKWTAADGTNRTKTKFRVNSFTQISYGHYKPEGSENVSVEATPADEVISTAENPSEMVAN